MTGIPGESLSIGQCATLACLLEVTAPKPGNVHRGADFEDVTFVDFVASAVAIGPAMEHAVRSGVGAAVLDAVEPPVGWSAATRIWVRSCCWLPWQPYLTQIRCRRELGSSCDL